MNTPKISIITIVKNDPEGLLITARSILHQDYPHIEWIVVDGMSTDITSHYLKNLSIRFSRLIREPDTGVYDAMNKGIEAASGDWTFFMNADDTFHGSHTVSAYARHLRQDDDIVYADVVRREDGRLHFHKPFEKFWLGMVFDHQTVLTRTQIYKTLRYDERYRVSGDFDLFSRAKALGYRFRKLPWVIGCRKPYCHGISSNYFDRQVERLKVIQAYHRDKPWRSHLMEEYAQERENGNIDNETFHRLKKLLEE